MKEARPRPSLLTLSLKLAVLLGLVGTADERSGFDLDEVYREALLLTDSKSPKNLSSL